MKRLLSFIFSISILLAISTNIFAATEDGLDYNTAFTITDFYNIPVVNCDDGEGLVYKFTAPATATYTIVSISDHDIFGRLEDSDKKAITWYGNTYEEDEDFELIANLTKGKIYYLWTNPTDVDVASYTMRISYEMKSGEYTYDAYTNECAITAYTGSASSVTIPEILNGKKVIRIDQKAFYNNTSLTSVSLPKNVTTLGMNCFKGCTALTTISLNDGLQSIGKGAFEGCIKLKQIQIPSSVTEFNTSVFEDCISLTDIKFSEGLEIVGQHAFRGCTSLSSITFPKSLLTLGNYAFRDCTSLKEVVFQEKLQYIKEYTFRGCTALTDVTFLNPDTVFNSDDDIFYKCSGFTIHGYDGSTAQAYAQTYSMSFEPISTYIPVQDFSLEERVLYLTVGDTYKLTPVFVPANATNQNILWKVSNDKLVSVSDTGVITVKAAGEAVVAANVLENYDETTRMWVNMVDIIIEEDDNIPDPEQQENTFKVYEPVYEYVRQFRGDYVSVYNNGVYSLLDSQNNKHYSSNQDGFGDYSENIIATYDAEKSEITFSNLDGYAFTLVGYKWAGEFLGGKCVVVDSDGMYGLIDTEGNFIIECLYDEIIYDTSDTVLLCSDSSWASVTLGQNTYSLRSRSSVPELYNPVLSVTGEHIIASNGTAYGILTSDNIQITDFQYDLIRDVQNGLFVGYYGDLVDLIELDGTVTATLTAYFVGGYSENKIAVFDGTKFFYVDKNGRIIVDINIDDIISAEEFHESYAVINVDGKGYTYINTSGNIAVDSYWDYAARFAEGYALVMNYFNDNDGNNLRKWSIIDTEFNIVMTLEDDLYIDATDEHSTDFSNGYIRTVDRATNLMGFIRLEDEEPINAVTVSGTVTSSDSDTTDTGNDLITITLANEENSYSKTLISSGVNNTGAYSIEGVSTGIYTMTVQKDDHIDREYTVVVGSDDVTQDVEICLLGDVNGDGRVNVGDANLVYKHALQTKLITDEYTLLCSNVNGDARVNVGDANLIYKHALQTKKLW